MYNNSLNILGQALVDTGLTLIAFLPSVVIAIIIFALGWLAGTILGRAVYHLITVLRIDTALHKAGFDKLSQRAGMRVSLAGFLASLIKWLIIVAFTIASAEILGLTQVTQLLRDILVFIPQVIIAAIVLVIAALVGDFVARLVDHSTRATGLKGHFAAQVAKWAIIIIGGIFPALAQLKIAPGLVEVLFTGIVFAVSLALGLSFGLGGREAAARTIEKMKFEGPTGL
ncbi:MAG: small-conductance mechanosensitive ion channel [Candidatus Nomurabacteria bacterium]|nr:small-conductance mechanosensitive ion channel [Candidatus Nomurabacteria bacterium]